VADGTAINNFVHFSAPIDFNDIVDNGFHGINLGSFETDVLNAPTDLYHKPARLFMIVSSCGFRNSSNVKTQILVNRGGEEIDSSVYIRHRYNAGWSTWRKFAFTSDIPSLSKYVPLSTYQALETRVQALEAKLANQ
jgi:hypothetical protein